MSVTLCLVTRNQEDVLEPAVRSADGLATEIVVADTGSTDGTTAAAERLGARVVPVAWADDFAAANNAALDAATGDWILWMNPDERLAPGSAKELAAAIGEPKVLGFLVKVQQELRQDRPGYGTAGHEPRLFRRDPEVRWQGRSHPRFVPAVQEIAARRKMIVAPAPANAAIHRLAYLSKVTPDKLRWAARLLEAELNDRPGQLPYLIEYGRHLLWLNEPRGHEVLAEAAEQVRAAADAPGPPTPLVGMLLEYLLAVSPEQSRSKVTRDEARALAAKWFSRTPPVLWAVANERYTAKDYATAAEVLTRMVELGRSGKFDAGGSFDPAIVGPQAWLNLASCRLHLGDWIAAKACVAGLLTDPEYRDRAAQIFAHAERQAKPTT